MRRTVISVVALVLLVLAVGFTWLTTAPPLWGQQGSAIGALKTIETSERLFHEKCGRFGTLAELSSASLVDSVLGSGTKQGYVFEAAPAARSPELAFWASARPQHEGDRIFFVNQGGRVHYLTWSQENLAKTCDAETAALPSDAFAPRK
jgi:hypothetical protein